MSAKPRLESVLKCPVCNSGPQDWVPNAKAIGAGPYEDCLFSIYRCRKCGVGITEPVPPDGESHLLYQERQSSDFQGDDSRLATLLKSMAADRDVRAFCGAVEFSRTAGKLVDYACGNGAFALSMKRIFPAGAVWAADYHAEVPAMLRGTDVHYAPYGGLPTHGPFDFILCRHVLEHTYDPVRFLREIGNLMAPGGILAIEVPNLEAPLRRVFGRYWDGYYVPYHPIHFSGPALRRAVVDAGFVPEKAGSSEMPKLGRSVRNSIGCKYNGLLFMLGILLHPAQLGARLLTGQGTCLRLWARKP
jgi:SAM-dependent methyltransferase